MRFHAKGPKDLKEKLKTWPSPVSLLPPHFIDIQTKAQRYLNGFLKVIQFNGNKSSAS